MKPNKKIVLLAIFLLPVIVTKTFAQDIPANVSVSGIYLSSNDYSEGKLSFTFSCNTSGKIKLNDFLSSAYVDVITDGKKIKLNKDSIFGYKNCKNETYRFYKKHDEEFLILENKSIVLYVSYVRVSSNDGKINNLVRAYFFSKTESSEIIPLTIQNLKHAFPGNVKFHAMLDAEFGSEEALSTYSANDGMYKVNYLFNKANQ